LAHTMPLAIIACPEATQVPASQQPPPPHLLPGQQACPGAPHCAHAPLVQVAPFWHIAPSARQPPLSQQPPLQVLLVQQAWPLPPQVPQLPFMHVPPTVGQVEPDPVQTLLTQQPPEAQLLAAQQASPGSPQWVHTLAGLQTSLASQTRPGQQFWPAPP